MSSSNAGGVVSWQANSRVSLTNCVIWSNAPAQIATNQGYSGANYCNIQNGYAGTGNTTNDPVLYMDHYHLFNTNSACYNAGTTSGMPTVDIDGLNRPLMGGMDIGCAEYSDTNTNGLPDWYVLNCFGVITSSLERADQD